MARWTIHTYTIEITDELAVMMPDGARVLSVHMRGDSPQIWALVDLSADVGLRRFALYVTGQPVSHPDWDFVGTLLLRGGYPPAHLFAEPS